MTKFGTPKISSLAAAAPGRIAAERNLAGVMVGSVARLSGSDADTVDLQRDPLVGDIAPSASGVIVPIARKASQFGFIDALRIDNSAES